MSLLVTIFSVEYNLHFTQTPFSCNNLNFAGGQVMKNAKKHGFVCNVPKTYIRLLI